MSLALFALSTSANVCYGLAIILPESEDKLASDDFWNNIFPYVRVPGLRCFRSSPQFKRVVLTLPAPPLPHTRTHARMLISTHSYLFGSICTLPASFWILLQFYWYVCARARVGVFVCRTWAHVRVFLVGLCGMISSSALSLWQPSTGIGDRLPSPPSALARGDARALHGLGGSKHVRLHGGVKSQLQRHLTQRLRCGHICTYMYSFEPSTPRYLLELTTASIGRCSEPLGIQPVLETGGRTNDGFTQGRD